jgi:hypothetical protein
VLTTLKRISNLYKLQEKKKLWYDENFREYAFNKPYQLWDIDIGVRKLQAFLVSYGTLEENPTGYFGPKTLKALYQFQLNEWLLDENSPKNLYWYMWPSHSEWRCIIK